MLRKRLLYSPRNDSITVSIFLHKGMPYTCSSGCSVDNVGNLTIPPSQHSGLFFTEVLFSGWKYNVRFTAKSTIAGDILHVDAYSDSLPEKWWSLTTEFTEYNFPLDLLTPVETPTSLRFFTSGEKSSGTITIKDAYLDIEIPLTKINYLYNRGNEFTDKTGSWGNYFYASSYGTTINTAKEVSEIRITDAADKYCGIGYSTQNKINLTNIRYLGIKFKMTDASGYSAGNVSIGCTNSLVTGNRGYMYGAPTDLTTSYLSTDAGYAQVPGYSTSYYNTYNYDNKEHILLWLVPNGITASYYINFVASAYFLPSDRFNCHVYEFFTVSI